MVEEENLGDKKELEELELVRLDLLYGLVEELFLVRNLEQFLKKLTKKKKNLQFLWPFF